MDKELPNVKKEIKKLVERVGKQLDDLGEERPTAGHLRTYLTRLAMRFHILATAALHGNYDITDMEFFSATEGPEDHVRVRAFLHFANTRFAIDMREHGHTLKVGDSQNANRDSESEASDVLNSSQIEVSEVEMKEFVLAKYRHTRGRELPGNSNHILLAELFHHQSKGWKRLAENHVADVATGLDLFARDAIMFVTPEEKVRNSLLNRIERVLLDSRETARLELDRLFEDKNGSPITYNHYYTDNVQNARHATTRGLIKKALEETSTVDYNHKMHISNTAVDAEKLLGALQRRVLVDMEDQACSEARQGLLAYYKVFAN
ncbi:hypothetical protein B0A55_06271 [Friedmanniomyces simplex]|uniref:Uncharacterized protein n=1 Tax=Friedmanniomyces simplex TaxID=329884 RepID=A0A4U0XPB1_9PEZI|nr:hypothetical protein B0A55_06271 [Friedmanniomyces simplex]